MPGELEKNEGLVGKTHGRIAPIRDLNVSHIITGLDTGGAEMMLYKLLSTLDRASCAGTVVSLTDIGPVGRKIEALGVPVRALRLGRRLPNPFGVLRLARWLRAERPALVQTWLYHADLVGGIAGALVRVPVIWGVRQSNLDRAVNKRRTLHLARWCARLSRRLPARIVFNSHTSRAAHVRLGYAPEKSVVIPNGFDLQRFRPDAQAREAVRAELGVARDAVLIGLVGRFDPQKDHRNFVRAAAVLHGQRPDVYFVLCGDGIDASNRELRAWIDAAGVGGVCRLLGRRDDIPRLTAAFDIATSASVGEGFANVIGEAMACGVPCVVTDVGDSADVVGETGRVVPAGEPQALAAAWSELIALGAVARATLGQTARLRVEQHYSLPAVAARYAALYAEVANDVRARRIS